MRAAALLAWALVPPTQGAAAQACLTGADLAHGLVLTEELRGQARQVRHRQLRGPLVGRNFASGAIRDAETITYANLFTHRHGRDGQVVQLEEPQVDMDALLRFEPGTEHRFESVRRNPMRANLVWRIAGTYRIETAPEIEMKGCRYDAVRVLWEGTLTMPDGSVRDTREDFVLIPDLLVRVSGTGRVQRDVTAMRRRTPLDGWSWPFSGNAAKVLDR